MSELFYEKTEKEANLQAEVIELALTRGWFCQKVVFVGRRGCQDVVAIRRGRVVWIEVKREGEEPRKQQAKVARDMQKHGAEVFAVDKIEDARKILQ